MFRTFEIVVAAALMSLAASQAQASDTTDVAATIAQYAKNDQTKAGAALCAPQAAIIDDFGPQVWQGANACQGWVDSLAVFYKQNGITDAAATLGKPRHIDVTGDRAYAVYPATITFSEKGKPGKLEGEWSFAMQKIAGSWRIAGWAWTDR
jgi:ketosteroid isomerase-like protein